MTPEDTVEWYQFTCPRCQARWAERYQVRRVTDDAGQTRSFYTRHGLGCEAPARAQIICRGCGHAPVQAEIAGNAPARGIPAPLGPVHDGRPVVPRNHRPLGALRRFTFKAIISLDGWHPGQPEAQNREETRSLMVHVPDPDPRGTGSFLPAVIARDDEQPLRPGDSHVTVTISVPGGEASGLFLPGSRFALWAGADIGYGTVTRRVFFR